jgi:hypothetical protein
VWQIVSQSLRCLGIEGLIGENGAELALDRFDSPESVLAGRAQPDHVIAQRARTTSSRRRLHQQSDSFCATTSGRDLVALPHSS